MRILIAEEALQTGSGHWPGYVGGIAAHFRDAGDTVDILAHKGWKGSSGADLHAVPWFSRNCWRDAASQGAVGGLRHNATFQRELEDWLRQSQQPYDWVCALTMRLQHLLAFARMARSGILPPRTRLLLLFVQGFGRYGGPERPFVFPSNPSTLLARWCFRLMARAVRSGKVVLAAETGGMKRELEAFTGLPVCLFPHPVPPPESIPPPGAAGGPLTLSCPGFARHEKGSDLLQEAIRILRKDSGFPPARFILQWRDPFGMPDGTHLSPHADLLKDPLVEFLNDNLDARAYEAFLCRSDIVLLPYRRVSYHHRVSRIAIEAASRAKPLVYMSGTWSAEIAELAGAGVAIGGETPEALAQAIHQAVAAYPAMADKAQSGAEKVATFHSAAQFRRLMAVEAGT